MSKKAIDQDAYEVSPTVKKAALKLLDVLIAAGGYRMVSMSLNTFGVPPEANREPLPALGR